MQNKHKAGNLDSLRFFMQVFQTSSLKEAATRVGQTLPSASRHLNELRENFHDQLFITTGHGFVPTARARELAQTIPSLLEQFDALLEPPVFSPATLQQTFRIGCVDNGAFVFLPPVIRELLRQAPHCSVDIVPLTQNLFEQLRQGEMDLAVYPIKDIPLTFHQRNFSPATYSCLVARDHPLLARLQDKGALTIEDFAQYRRIDIKVEGNSTFMLDDIAFMQKSPQKSAVRVPYFLAAPQMLIGTNLTLTLPTRTAQLLAQNPQYAVLPYPLASIEYQTRIIWHQRQHCNPAQQWLRSLFVSTNAS